MKFNADDKSKLSSQKSIKKERSGSNSKKNRKASPVPEGDTKKVNLIV